MLDKKTVAKNFEKVTGGKYKKELYIRDNYMYATDGFTLISAPVFTDTEISNMFKSWKLAAFGFNGVEDIKATYPKKPKMKLVLDIVEFKTMVKRALVMTEKERNYRIDLDDIGITSQCKDGGFSCPYETKFNFGKSKFNFGKRTNVKFSFDGKKLLKVLSLKNLVGKIAFKFYKEKSLSYVFFETCDYAVLLAGLYVR